MAYRFEKLHDFVIESKARMVEFENIFKLADIMDDYIQLGGFDNGLFEH